MRILIANTDNEMIKDVRLALDRYQPRWFVSIINSSKECIDIVKNGNCNDVVILGINNSDISSPNLIKEIREVSGIPILVISSDNNLQTLIQTLDMGANQYIVKPFSKPIFIALLKALIRRNNWDIQALEKKGSTHNPSSCNVNNHIEFQ
jgi:two-component system, cell cycle response regulator CtrA